MTYPDLKKTYSDSARLHLSAAFDNLKTNHPDWAFFLFHLTIAKLLKGLIAGKGETPPPIHNLVRLAEAAGVPLDDNRFAQLKEISTYCIEARYDDLKLKFYHKVSEPKYRDNWSNICRETILWLQKMY